MKLLFFLALVLAMSAIPACSPYRAAQSLPYFHSRRADQLPRLMEYENLPETILSEDTRIRIYARFPIEVKLSNNLNATINKYNKEVWLSLGLIRREKLSLEVTPENIKLNWDPAQHADGNHLKDFKDLVAREKLGFEVLLDPYASQCLPKNKKVLLNLSYQFTLMGSTTKAEQKSLDYECEVDDKGNIRLPVIHNDTNPNTIDFSQANYLRWYEATGNSYTLHLGELSCTSTCMTYKEAADSIARFYNTTLKRSQAIQNLYIRLTPPETFSDLTLYYMGRVFHVPYVRQTLHNFFATPAIRMELGFRKKRFKAVVMSPCAKYTTPSFRMNFKIGTNRSSSPFLLPGDKVYLY